MGQICSLIPHISGGTKPARSWELPRKFRLSRSILAATSRRSSKRERAREREGDRVPPLLSLSRPLSPPLPLSLSLSRALSLPLSLSLSLSLSLACALALALSLHAASCTPRRSLAPEDPAREIGVLMPNNQRQHRTLHIQKDVLPNALYPARRSSATLISTP